MHETESIFGNSFLEGDLRKAKRILRVPEQTDDSTVCSNSPKIYLIIYPIIFCKEIILGWYYVWRECIVDYYFDVHCHIQYY